MSFKCHLKITLSLIIRNERVSDTFIIIFMVSVILCFSFHAGSSGS